MSTERIVQRQGNKKKVIKKIILGILITLFLLIIGGLSYVPHMIMKDMVNMHVEFDEVHAGEEFGIISEKVELKTEDGLKIVAHEVKVDKPKAMVIFLSGIQKPSVTTFFGHGKMLKDNGY